MIACGHKFTTAEFITPWPKHTTPKGITFVDSADIEQLRELVARMPK